MNQQRLECERLIYKVMEILDNPKEHDGDAPNVEFWVQKFAKMNDKEFEQYVTRPLSLFYQTSGIKREPSMIDIMNALKEIDIPLFEEVYLPYKYKNMNGKPLKTKKALVLYLHIKRMKQILTKKNGMSIDSKTRNMMTGLLTGVDKNGKESDHEFESLGVSGLNSTMKELSRMRADSMEDKSVMTSTIKTMGQVKLSELPDEKADSLSKNTLSAYFLGAGLFNNLVINPITYETPYTVKNKKLRMQRV